MTDLAVADEIAFPGASRTPATLSFHITYTKSGEERTVRPTSNDPLSGFTWAGKISRATNFGTFSVAYNDGTFSAQGSFSSGGKFGEMGTERNGTFAQKGNDAEAEPFTLEQGPSSTVSPAGSNESAEQQWTSPRLKGRERH